MNVTGWSKGLEVTGGGEGVVSHAGLVLLRGLADKTGLTAGLSRALVTPRLLVHDRGRVLADLACAIADGAEVISGGVRPGAAWAQHPGQRLGGVVAVAQQRVQAKSLEIGLCTFLVGMAGHHAGIEPDAHHALDHLVRDPHPRGWRRAAPRSPPTRGGGRRSPPW